MEIQDRRDELLYWWQLVENCRLVGPVCDWLRFLCRRTCDPVKKEGDLTVRSKDGMKGYLLRVRAKRYLLEEYGEDVEPYLSGAGATSHVKSEPEKRLRLHRMSMVWVFCHRADIRIFKSDKPELFPAVHRTLLGSGKGGFAASYYGTMEWENGN